MEQRSLKDTSEVHDRDKEFYDELGNSAALRPFVKREVMPGNLKGIELERFIRDAATSFWHETCTAKP